jgi:magnesium chelatase family protein
MRVEVAAVPNDDLLNAQAAAQSSGEGEGVAARVLAAQRLQLRRAGKLNAEIAAPAIEQMCRLDRRCRALVAQARDKLQLSARGLHRALRVARTIADLEWADLARADAGNDTGPKDFSVSPAHLAEALQLRRAIE